MKSHFLTIPFVAFFVVSAPSAAADPLLTTHQLPVAVAESGIAAARANCATKGFRVSAAVVNREGGLQALIRDDGAGLQTVQSATDKAITSALFGVDSGAWVALAAKGEPISPLLNHQPHLLLAAGGLVIKVDDEVIGGIAVAGAPGGNLDEECAEAGLSTIMKSLNR